MDKKKFKNLHFFPDPLIQDDGHYVPFEKVFTLTTTEKDCPSLRGKSMVITLSFSPSVQHVKNNDTMIQCEECGMWCLVFSNKKLSAAAHSKLQSILDDVSYTC